MSDPEVPHLDTAIDAARKSWIKVNNALSALDAAVPETVATLQRALETHRRALAAVESGLPGAAQRMDVTSFFQGVGSGIIAAQRELDRESRAYLATVGPHAHPSVFRIPKVEAKFQFAAEKFSKQGFDVLVYASSSGKSEMQQHSVSFEIVSAPPPAEVLARLATLDVFSGLAVSRAVRDWIRGRLARIRDPNLDPDRTERIDAFLAAWPRVLILRGARDWLLLLASPETDDDDPNLDLLVLSLEGDPGDLQYWKSQTSPPRFRPLMAELARLAAMQEAALSAGAGE